MSRARKIGAIVGGSIVGLLLLAVVAGIVIVQTQWFRDTVRAKIVAAVEEATGGTVAIRSFAFDWKHLRATVDEFVVHGLEPAGAAPLLRVKRLQVDLKLLSPFKGMVDIAYLGIDTPQANVIVFPDGRTNIPAPKIKKPSDKNGLETIVDLAIRRFDLTNGLVTFANRQSDLNASGENLRAQLAYNLANPSYSGEIDVSPLRVGNLNVDVKLPVALEKDKVALTEARLSTPQSVIVISGAMEHLADPRSSAHINARLALDDVKQAARLTMPLDTARGPNVLTADITAAMDAASIRLTSARMNLGKSAFEASGTLQDSKGPAGVEFNSTLALGEVGRLLRLAARPEGTVKLGGNATLKPGNDYLITANVDARNVAISQGATRLGGIALDSAVTVDPHRIELGGLRLAALGGSFAGAASVENLDRFHVSGTLRNFDLQQMLRAFAAQPPGYDGIISGPVDAQGSIQRPAELVAHANLAIAPGRAGVPITGRIAADYNGRADTVTLAPSYLALPNTRADLAGALGRQIRVHVVSRNLSDFRPLAPTMPVALERGGAVTIDADVSGKLSAPQIAAQVAVTNFTVEGRPFTRAAASVNASSAGASIANGVLERGALRADFTATAGLRNWKPESFEPLRADVTMRNADLADVLALAGQPPTAATGALTADAHINGTIGDPQGNADLTVVNGTLQGQRFDRLATRVVMTPGTIAVPALELVAGPSRIDGNATYQHAANDLARGTLRAHVASNQVQLAQFRPDLKGVLTLNADAAANIASTVEITAVTGNASVRGIQAAGKSLGDATITAATAGNAIQYNVNSNFGGSTIRVNGSSLLAGDHRTTANAVIEKLPIESVLAVAGEPNPAVHGTVNATAQVSGTLAQPQGSAHVDLAVGPAGKQKLEQATVTAEARGKDLTFTVKSGIAGARIDGGGTMGLAGDYPLTAHLSLANVTAAGLRDWISGVPEGVEAVADGEVQVAGPAARTEDLRGAFRLTRLEAHAVAAGPAGAKPRTPFEIHNDGPIVVSLDRSLVTVQSARLTGTSTTLALTGTASLRNPPSLNLRADGDIKLDVLQAFSPDIFSSGAVSLHASVTGTPSQPAINGRLQLQNASFHSTDLPNGLTNGTGSAVFTGTEAVLENVTGETGGGKVTLAGYVTYGGPQMQFRVQANADQVRVEYPATVSTQLSARLTWAGATARSLLSGTVTIEDVALHSHSDVGSMLTSAAAPVASPTTSTGIMAGLRFDVKVQTAPGVQFRTTLTQNLQAEANLTLRGTVDHPGMLGRLVVTQGQVVFFGHKYDIDQGTVAFYDPQKINPVLNVDLETTAQGVDVSMSVTGPMDRLKFAYRSDPPMLISDLLSLLASGTPPTTDPVLAARAPVPPEQNLEQRGASTLLGQAVGNPVSGRLQRLFGVSALKIDPQIIGSNTPQATLTLQQQITKDLTFTYIQDVTQSNPQIIRVEWAIDPQWSAIAQRDLNGMFDLDFFYKKRFW